MPEIRRLKRHPLRTLLALSALACLGGCATVSDTHARYLQSKCAIFGFEPGTSAHAACYAEKSLEWETQTWGESFM